VSAVELQDWQIGDAVDALTGSKPEARFRFIPERGAYARDLDI